MAGKKLIVLDFDGTLFFSYSAARAASRELLKRDLTMTQIKKLPTNMKGKVYSRAYSKYAHLIAPNNAMIRRMRRAMANNDLVIMTARPARHGDRTDSYLSGAKIKRIKRYHRNDVSIPDKVWKLSTLMKITKGYGTIDVYEDKATNLRHFANNLDENKFNFYHVKNNVIRRYK